MITKEQWNDLEKKHGLFSFTKLICDGYELTLRAFIHKNKIEHCLYVNGWFNGEWLNEDKQCPELKFYYRRKCIARLYSDAELRKMKRLFGKEYAERFAPKTYYVILRVFPSFKAFKRQIIAVCTDIQLND